MSTDSPKYQVSIPDEFIPFLNKQQANKSLDDQVKILLAVGLFIEKQVTVARAAELAGMSLSDFIDMLGGNNIPWMEYTAEDKKMDDVAMAKWISEQEQEYE